MPDNKYLCFRGTQKQIMFHHQLDPKNKVLFAEALKLNKRKD